MQQEIKLVAVDIDGTFMRNVLNGFFTGCIRTDAILWWQAEISIIS